MNVNTIDITHKEPVNITPMTAAEARECTELIRKDLATIETIQVRLLDMERRQGFKALGYSSWREWATKEYSNSSQAYLYRLLAAAKVEANLATDSTIVEIDIPISQLTELAKLPAPQQPVALQKADELAMAKGKPRTAADVADAVRQLKPKKPPKHGLSVGDPVRVLLGKGKHSDKITTVTAVSGNCITTGLGEFKASALVKYVDLSPEMKALGIVPGVSIQIGDLKAQVACTFADGRVLVMGRYYNYKNLTVLTDSAEQEQQYTSLEQETIAVSKSVGLPTKGESVLPTSDTIDSLTRTSLADVDDRPFTTPDPKTGWDISPQQLSTTVKGHKIAVHFEDRGDEFFFGFRGPESSISKSGFYSESVGERSLVSRQYLNPGVWADFKAEKLYVEYQKSLSNNNQTSESEALDNDPANDYATTTGTTDSATLADVANHSNNHCNQATTTTQDNTQSEPGSREAAISKAQARVLLSCAVETCLREFAMPRNLEEQLHGKVYVSPSTNLDQWVNKLLKAYKSGEVKEAIALLPLNHQVFVKFADYALCPLTDSLIAVYLGKRVKQFVLCFEELGMVWHRYEASQ